MQNKLINYLRIFFILILVILGVLVLFKPAHTETNILKAIFSTNEDNLLVNLSTRFSSKINVIVESDSSEKAENAAKIFYYKVNKKKMSSSNINVTGIIEDYEKHQNNLLSNDTRKLLINKDYDFVVVNSYETLYNPTMPPVGSIEKDPFLLLSDFVMNLNKNSQMPTDFTTPIEYNNKYYSLIILDISPKLALSPSVLNPEIEKLISLQEELSKNGIKIYLSGAPIHSYYASSHSIFEINLICILSTLFLIGLILFYFGSLFPLIPIAISLWFGIYAGYCVTALIFKDIHILTFVFSTTLIGVCVDYSLHYFVAMRECTNDDVIKSIFKSLTVSLITTVSAFLILLFADFVLLRQISVFTIIGLITVYCIVVLWYPVLIGIIHEYKCIRVKVILKVAKRQIEKAYRYLIEKFVTEKVKQRIQGFVEFAIAKVNYGLKVAKKILRFYGKKILKCLKKQEWYETVDHYFKEYVYRYIKDIDIKSLLQKIKNILQEEALEEVKSYKKNIIEWWENSQNIRKFIDKITTFFASPIVCSFFLVAIVLGIGLCHVSFDDNIKNMYTPPKNLLNAEKLFTEVVGTNNDTTIFVVNGKNLQEILEKEENISDELEANKDVKYQALSKFVPSEKRQKSNQILRKELYQARLNEYAVFLPVQARARLLRQGIDNDFLVANNHFDFLKKSFLIDKNTSIMLVSGYKGEPIKDAKIINFQKDISSQIRHCRKICLGLLIPIFGLLYLLLAKIYDYKSGLKILLPSICAVIFVFAILGLFGSAINLFHLLAIFLIVGFGLDYSVFRFTNPEKSNDSVLLSCMTTVFSFALLAFAGFKLISSLGIVLALGLLSSYIFSIKLISKDKILKTTKNER